jgi:protein arginine N-methyltransferase 1
MYSVHHYGEMILDRPRMEAYESALCATVKPGCVVADIGTGTGIFAMLACRLGARRVFAIEPNPAIAVAREIAAANGFAERIEFFEALSTCVELPERADVIVSDLRGVLPVFSHHIPAIMDARKRHLAAGGTLIAERDEIWAALLEDSEAHRRVTAPWLDNAFGLDMAAAARILANNMSRIHARADQLLTAPVRLGSLDYRNIEHTGLAGEFRSVATRDGIAHGICAWFDSVLAPGITLSNAPGQPRLIYGEAFFPWPRAVDITTGDEISVALRGDLIGENYVFTWNSRVASTGGRTKAEFAQSNFLGEAGSAVALRKRGSSYMPTLADEGEIERTALEQMDGKTSLADIARDIARRYPTRFARWEEALAHVGEISSRLGR